VYLRNGHGDEAVSGNTIWRYWRSENAREKQLEKAVVMRTVGTIVAAISVAAL
jgi:hypothetical protein